MEVVLRFCSQINNSMHSTHHVNKATQSTLHTRSSCILEHKKEQQQRPIAGIKVADQTREWVEGSTLVLDDSYIHEVWNDSTNTAPRVLFLLDIWHPDVRMEERERIGNMFDFARGQGWIGGAKQKR